ncbi:MAG: hypothetical protein IPM11_00750 [Micropruina sp.]|nr:hypothetical protein [Micropruina sp.]
MTCFLLPDAEALTALKVALKAEKPGTESDADITLAAEAACEYIEGRCGPVTSEASPIAPAWAITAARIITRQLWRTQLGRTLDPNASAGFLAPRAAEELMAPHYLPPLGFA